MTANPSTLDKQLLDMVKLSDYASAQEDLLNYEEALKAYKEIANIAKYNHLCTQVVVDAIVFFLFLFLENQIPY